MDSFNGLLTATVFLPLAGALVIAAFVKRDSWVRWAAALIAVVELALSIEVMAKFSHGAGAERFQLIDKFGWFGVDSIFNNTTFSANYFLGVDGLSAPLVLLTGLLGFCAVLGSWNVKHRVREYFAWLLALQTAVMGVFASWTSSSSSSSGSWNCCRCSC